MHVLILPSWYPADSRDIGGSFFREQAVALTKVGCQVGVIVPSLRSIRNPITAFRGPFGIHYENDQGINTYRSHNANFFPKMPRLASCWWKRLGLELYKHYVESHGHPDVIHVHSMLNAGFIAHEINERYGVPYVVTEHSTGFARKQISVRQAQSAQVIARGAQARFAVSIPFRDLLTLFLGSNCGDWQVLPNIVNDVFFRENIDYPVQQEFTFLNVCLLTAKKQVDLLLAAFCLAYKDNDSVKLRIGGDGRERKSLMLLAEKLGVASQVTFLGALTRQQVAEEMSAMDVFVLSSQYETFGVVLIEALAKGKPVIATRCGGPEDIVRKNDGILVPVNDVQAMAEAMKTLHQNYSSFQRDEIRSACKSRYSERTIANRLVEIYRNVIKKQSSVVV